MLTAATWWCSIGRRSVSPLPAWMGPGLSDAQTSSARAIKSFESSAQLGCRPPLPSFRSKCFPISRFFESRLHHSSRTKTTVVHPPPTPLAELPIVNMCSSGNCNGNVKMHITSWANCNERMYNVTGSRNYAGIRTYTTCGTPFVKSWWEECDKSILITPTITTKYTVCPSHRNRIE